MSSTSVYADIFEPFTTSNLNPFVQIHGIPQTRSAKTVSDNKFAWRVQTDFANHFTADSDIPETINLDGETYKVTATLRYGLSDRLEVGIDVPYIKHDGGSLDNFIENWHDFWGLPNGRREDVEQDLLNITYSDGISMAALTESESGIGDVRLHFGYQLRQTEEQVWTVRGGVKLPTGDSDKFTGSDATDVFASLHLSHAAPFENERLYFHGHAGVIALGDGDILSERQEDWVFYGSSGLAWQFKDRMSLKTQLDFHSPFYDSDLIELGEFSVQIILGGTLKLSESIQLDISLAEDITTDSSPDVVFQFGLHSVW